MNDEQYIKMCEKAVEIQDVWEPKVGDYFQHGSVEKRRKQISFIYRETTRNDGTIEYWITQDIGGHYHIQTEINFNSKRPFFVWLPTQEQLQGMVRKSDKHHVEFDESDYSVHKRFDKWLHDFGVAIYDNGFYQSWVACFNNNYSEMWLAFVMHELFGKAWNNCEWITK